MHITTYILLLPFFQLHVTTAAPAGPYYIAPNSSFTHPDDNNADTFAAAGSLLESYDGSNWLDLFEVQDIPDPTHGFVNYVNAQRAQELGLLQVRGSQVYMGVDTSTVLDPAAGRGRDSIRIQSKRAYNQVLVIADFAHIPGSQCGTWPAFWMLGPSWPHGGELDILEGVHTSTFNQITLHTSPGCSPSVGPGGQTGQAKGEADCGAGGGFVGCSVESTHATSYGTAFNAKGGGVYAALWRGDGIKVWYWAAGEVPGDVREGRPVPGEPWGTPQANFGSAGGGCDFGARFRDMRIVFDITFCGDWAGAVWGQTGCAAMNPSCQAYVASQPQSFVESYWLINSVKVHNV